jgi:predicted regulator of Ras-like GTPase activity (Roadblock/LC7/MglB family)
VPYQALLDGLVRDVAGALGALLLDANGEVVVQSGERDERHRLIGACQGIALHRAQTTHARFEQGSIDHVLCRYASGQVILRPLKDGYYLVMSLAADANLGQALFRTGGVRDRMNLEI